jgi:hypothetical protein
MNQTSLTIRKISNRLATALAVLTVLMIAGAFYARSGTGGSLVTAPIAAFAAGVVGGFVGLQRRLKSTSEEDLALLANSWVYVCLSPLVGGILAVVLYVLFISQLVSGKLFPEFVLDTPAGSADPGQGFAAIFAVHGGAVDYAKMMFWSFVAGFSERFVTDIVSRFDSASTSRGDAKD